MNKGEGLSTIAVNAKQKRENQYSANHFFFLIVARLLERIHFQLNSCAVVN